jgi:hypothetical protein
MWQLESSIPNSEPLSRHILELLSRVAGESAVWDEVSRRFSADIYCSLDVRLPNSGTELSREAIDALAARKLGVQFDLYAMADDRRD